MSSTDHEQEAGQGMAGSDDPPADDERTEPPTPAFPLPPSIGLAWGLYERPARGPRRGLTLDRLVAAGIKVALTDGLGALSMARVAKELGVGTMSLYRYVSAKDDLLALMFDAGIGSPPAIDPSVQDWREGLTLWAEGVRAAYHRHPWALRVPISAPPLGPNNVAWLEAALRALSNTPLGEQEKLSTVLLLSGFVRNEATLTADLAAGSAGEQVMPGYGTMLLGLLPAGGFPALRQAIASGALDDDDDLDSEFDFGLLRILDGVAALIQEYGPR
jgi:AcrR family transcriptional regulator